MTWPEVEALDRSIVVLIPTGSLEQHGPHLPLLTDTIIVTAVAEAVEARIPERVLLTPSLWLGASSHHLSFAGSLSADFDSYIGAISSIVRSLVPHGFQKFYVLNGHGGNKSPNDIAMRNLKEQFPNLSFGRESYYTFAHGTIESVLTGPAKSMQHACEAETSLMMHLRPDLIRTEKLQDDGLITEPPLIGMVHRFDEISAFGPIGFASLATADKGVAIIDSAIGGVLKELESLANGYVLRGRSSAPGQGK